MPDGWPLSARIWLPEDAVERPVPAILEYIPYRRDRGGGDSDGTWHSTVPAMASSRLRVARLYSLVRGLLGMDLTLGGERSEGER